MARKIIAIRLKDGGNRPSHIVHLWWITNDGAGTQEDGTRLDVVNWVERGGKAFVIGGGRQAYVEVDTTGSGVKYVRTIPDDSTRDNLLSLPKW